MVEVRGIYAAPLAEDTFRIVHMTAHRLPMSLATGERLVRVAVAILLLLVWGLLYPRAEQMRSFLAAAAYSLTEFCFTFLERGRPYTSAEQFAGNLLYTPFLLTAYGHVLLGHPWLYVLLFPANIWLLEIAQGHAFMWFHAGRNVAWCYLDYSDVACNGCLRWGHGVWWLVMGMACLALERHTAFGALAF